MTEVLNRNADLRPKPLDQARAETEASPTVAKLDGCCGVLCLISGVLGACSANYSFIFHV